MPEGVEVLRQTEWLKETYGDAIFVKIKCLTDKYKVEDDWKKYSKKTLHRIFCKGKRFFFMFSEDMCITFHHKMGGHWEETKTKYAKVRIDFQDSDGDKHSLYWCTKRLGEVDLLTSKKDIKELTDSIAPGFIGECKITKKHWMSMVETYTKSKSVRGALKEQTKLCSGIGNYLIAEIMYDACIHPKAKWSDLSTEQIDSLFYTCDDVVTSYYEGSRDHRVYGRKEDPHSNNVLKMTFCGTVHYVPEIQTIGN